MLNEVTSPSVPRAINGTPKPATSGNRGVMTITAVASTTVDIEVTGQGFYALVGLTEAGREFINTRVHGGNDGIAYTDDSRLLGDIVAGAEDDGLVVG